jgi:hypothetical protein
MNAQPLGKINHNVAVHQPLYDRLSFEVQSVLQHLRVNHLSDGLHPALSEGVTK